jgi:hypothetical protein
VCSHADTIGIELAGPGPGARDGRPQWYVCRLCGLVNDGRSALAASNRNWRMPTKAEAARIRERWPRSRFAAMALTRLEGKW